MSAPLAASPARRTVHSYDLTDPSHGVEVVGESFCQDALRELLGDPDMTVPVRARARAALARQPDNPHDPNAVGVVIAGKLVGYLPRPVALAYQSVFEALAERGFEGIRCEAKVAGGGEGRPSLGVFLRVAAPDTALSRIFADGETAT